jgi:hypothetical protein
VALSLGRKQEKQPAGDTFLSLLDHREQWHRTAATATPQPREGAEQRIAPLLRKTRRTAAARRTAAPRVSAPLRPDADSVLHRTRCVNVIAPPHTLNSLEPSRAPTRSRPTTAPEVSRTRAPRTHRRRARRDERRSSILISWSCLRSWFSLSWRAGSEHAADVRRGSMVMDRVGAERAGR